MNTFQIKKIEWSKLYGIYNKAIHPAFTIFLYSCLLSILSSVHPSFHISVSLLLVCFASSLHPSSLPSVLPLSFSSSLPLYIHFTESFVLMSFLHTFVHPSFIPSILFSPPPSLFLPPVLPWYLPSFLCPLPTVYSRCEMSWCKLSYEV